VREVLAARSGRDFTSVGTVRPRRARGRPSLAMLALAFVARRPGRVAGGALFLATAAFVSFNALTQSAPHPAPLFGSAQREAAPANRAPAPAPSRVESAPRPATQPAVPANIEDLLAPIPPARPVNETASISDPLGELIRSSTGSGTTGSVAPAGAVEPDPRLMAAQRALTKLGYGPLTEDGLFGPMTRSAIERFERDQGLTTTGQLAPQTVRALAVRSGVAID
jgi:hypothetical protein